MSFTAEEIQRLRTKIRTCLETQGKGSIDVHDVKNFEDGHVPYCYDETLERILPAILSEFGAQLDDVLETEPAQYEFSLAR